MSPLFQTEETKKKIGIASKRLWKNPAYRRKISAKLKGRKFTDETREKMSAARMGFHPSEETKKKMRQSWAKTREQRILAMRQFYNGEGRDSRKGYKNAHWKGGKTVNGKYIIIHCPGHPHADPAGYVWEHHLVWEKHNGRYVPDGHLIHHIDHDPQNNKIKNLKLMTIKKHQLYHIQKRPRLPNGRVV